MIFHLILRKLQMTVKSSILESDVCTNLRSRISKVQKKISIKDTIKSIKIPKLALRTFSLTLPPNRKVTAERLPMTKTA